MAEALDEARKAAKHFEKLAEEWPDLARCQIIINDPII